MYICIEPIYPVCTFIAAQEQVEVLRPPWRPGLWTPSQRQAVDQSYVDPTYTWPSSGWLFRLKLLGFYGLYTFGAGPKAQLFGRPESSAKYILQKSIFSTPRLGMKVSLQTGSFYKASRCSLAPDARFPWSKSFRLYRVTLLLKAGCLAGNPQAESET